MKLRIVSLMTWLTLSISSYAQFNNDPVLTTTVAVEAKTITKEMDETNKHQKNIMASQALIMTCLDQLQKYEDKTFKYLSNAQSAINNMHDIKRSYNLGNSIIANLNECRREAANHPQGAIVTLLISKRTNTIIEESTSLATTITGLVTKNGADNLLNSAERTRILSDVTWRLSNINYQLRSLKYQIIMYRWADLLRYLENINYEELIGSDFAYEDTKRNIDAVSRIF